MLASSAQETMEKTESVRGVKSVKPPIKPKPIVPTKPKQVPVSTPNTVIKSTLLSSNAGGPCSPTADIPSAVKISQLTGPQPYGTRRTSLKRWSAAVGEVVPDIYELQSLAETSVTDLSTKVMTQPLTAPVKSLQSGSVWKGKSPFVLTTRGWGEQRSGQGKGDHESESANQKHNYSLVTQDTDSKRKETVPLEENAVIKLSSSRSLVTEDMEDDVNIHLLSTSVPEDVKNIPFRPVTSGKVRNLELPDQVSESVKTQESSLETFISPKRDVSHGIVKQLSESGHIQDTEFEALVYKGDQETTPKTVFSGSTSPEKVDRTLTIQKKDVTNEKHLQTINDHFKLVENVALQSKDSKEPQIFFSAVTSVPKTNYDVAVNSEIINATEENPLSELSEPKVQDICTYNDHANAEQVEPGTLIRDEQDAASGYLQASWSPVYNIKIKAEHEIPQKIKKVEEHLVSFGSQLTNCSVDKIHNKTSHKNKENNDPTTATLLQDLQATYNSNKPHSDDEHKLVGLTSIHPTDHTMRPSEHYSGTQVCDDNKEENDHFMNRLQKADATIQSGGYVGHPAIMEKQREHPSENRLVRKKNEEFSYDPKIPSSPVLPKPPDRDTVPHSCIDSQILDNDNLDSGEGNAHLGDKSKKASYCKVESNVLAEPEKSQKELSQSKYYDPNRLGLSYCDSRLVRSSKEDLECIKRVTRSVEIDNYNQGVRLQYYKHSPTLIDHQVQFDNLETRKSDEPQYTHFQSKEHEQRQLQRGKDDDKHERSDAHVVQRYTQSGEPIQSYLQLEGSVDKQGETKEPSHVNSQAKESKPIYEQLEEPVYLNESEKKVKKCQSLEASVHKNEQLEEQYSTHRQSQRKSDESFHKDKQSMAPAHESKLSDQSVHKYDQLSELVRTEQPEVSVSKSENSQELNQEYRDIDEIVYRSEQSDKPAHTCIHSDELPDKYEQSYESIHTYQKPGEAVHEQYEHSEETDNRVVQSEEESVYKHTQDVHDKYIQSESVHSCNPVYQPELQEQEFNNAHLEENNSDHTHRQVELLYLQQQNIHVHLRETPYISMGSSEKDPILEENLKQPRDGYIKVTKFKETSTYNKLSNEITLEAQSHRDQLSEESHILSIHKQETKHNCNSPKEAQHVDGLPETPTKELLVERPENKSNELMPETTQTSTYKKISNEITLEEQNHRDQLSEEPHLISIHKQETQHNCNSAKEAQHVDGLPEKPTKELLVERPENKSDELLTEKIQDQEDKISFQDTILNRHSEHGELQSVDTILDTAKENKPEEPQEAQPEESPVENFDFLEGTSVLDSSYMRCRASLGRKRCHKAPAAGTCASEEEKDHEYWMFRDSTEPKIHPLNETERYEEEKDEDKISPDVTQDNSPSPGKLFKKGGIFAGIISPSILKGRLKSRSKTMEDEAWKKEAEESKSPAKETPESSSSLNWLHALKKKKKKQPK